MDAVIDTVLAGKEQQTLTSLDLALQARASQGGGRSTTDPVHIHKDPCC